jgi:voltage-gated potassium channel
MRRRPAPVAATGGASAQHGGRTVAPAGRFPKPSQETHPMLPPLFSRVLRLLAGRGERSLHGRATGGATAVLAAVMLLGSYAVVAAERGAAGANLTSYPRALWWSVETATTVGYGDFYPVTLWGRLVACVVMFAGITTYGVVTAAIATWFVSRDRRHHHHLAEAARREMEEHMSEDARALHERFDRMEHLVAAGLGGDGHRGEGHRG